MTEIPPGQQVALVDEIKITAAGTAAGTAVDLAKLGCNVLCMGAIGDDEVGNVLTGILQRHHVCTDYLVRKPNVLTSATILPIRPNGERPALHMLGANATFCSQDIHWETFKSASFIHFGGFYLLSSFDGEPTVAALGLAKSLGITTSMDVIGMPGEDMAARILPCMQYLDYFMPNIEEARLISGLEDEEAVADYFLSAGAGVVALKMGAQGSLVKRRGGRALRVQAYAVQVVDTTGCGDGWSAGFLAALSRGWSVEEAAAFGSACGSLVATGLGSDAGIIDFEFTAKFMLDHTKLSSY